MRLVLALAKKCHGVRQAETLHRNSRSECISSFSHACLSELTDSSELELGLNQHCVHFSNDLTNRQEHESVSSADKSRPAQKERAYSPSGCDKQCLGLPLDVFTCASPIRETAPYSEGAEPNLSSLPPGLAANANRGPHPQEAFLRRSAHWGTLAL